MKKDWQKMAVRVVQRVIQYGDVNDYYAMLQLYGGFQNVAEIVKKIPVLSPKDLNWACFLFDIKKEETLCYTRTVRKNQNEIELSDMACQFPFKQFDFLSSRIFDFFELLPAAAIFPFW